MLVALSNFMALAMRNANVARFARRLPFLVGGLLLLASAWPSLDLNFQRFTDDSHPYVYVQTYEEIDTAVRPLLEKANQDPRFYHAPGSLFLESYYPLPWILGDFEAVGYHDAKAVPDVLDAAFILCEEDNLEEVQAALAGAYYKREFRLRSGMGPCFAFFRHEDFKDQFEGGPDVIGTSRRDIAQ
jgi:hypothetical protein